MKYFLHDSSAFDDEKITELYINFGYEGLGLFYTVLEKLAKQEKPVKTLVLKQQLNVGKKLEKCWQFMESLGLLSSNNGDTFNKQLLNFSEKYAVKKQKNRERISQWRENQEVTENVTRYESVCNTDKVKESKVKESKLNEEEINKEDYPLNPVLVNDVSILDEIRNAEIWLTQLSITYKYDINRVKELADLFCKDRETLNDYVNRSLSDLRKHFVNSLHQRYNQKPEKVKADPYAIYK